MSAQTNTITWDNNQTWRSRSAGDIPLELRHLPKLLRMSVFLIHLWLVLSAKLSCHHQPKEMFVDIYIFSTHCWVAISQTYILCAITIFWSNRHFSRNWKLNLKRSRIRTIFAMFNVHPVFLGVSFSFCLFELNFRTGFQSESVFRFLGWFWRSLDPYSDDWES